MYCIFVYISCIGALCQWKEAKNQPYKRVTMIYGTPS